VHCLDHSCFWHSFNMAKQSQSSCSGEVYCVLMFYYLGATIHN
jgi:hypothetical protein